MAERAKRESEAKTDFLSQVSHDIRTPMNAVRGFTKIARENIDNKEKVRYGLDQIDIASNYLQQIVNDVLDLSRIEKGKLNILMEEMSVSEVFSQFRDTIQEVMPDKHQQISCRLKNIEYDRIILDETKYKNDELSDFTKGYGCPYRHYRRRSYRYNNSLLSRTGRGGCHSSRS